MEEQYPKTPKRSDPSAFAPGALSRLTDALCSAVYNKSKWRRGHMARSVFAASLSQLTEQSGPGGVRGVRVNGGGSY